MSEIRSKRLYSHNLPEDRSIETKINSKPTAGLLVFVFFGISLMCVGKLWIFGLLIALMALAGVLFIKNHVMTELSSDHAVFYKDTNREECFILYWDDVEEWKIMPMKTGLDQLIIELKDGEKVCFTVFSRRKIEKYFKKYAPNKPKIEIDDDDE